MCCSLLYVTKRPVVCPAWTKHLIRACGIASIHCTYARLNRVRNQWLSEKLRACYSRYTVITMLMVREPWSISPVRLWISETTGSTSHYANCLQHCCTTQLSIFPFHHDRVSASRGWERANMCWHAMACHKTRTYTQTSPASLQSVLRTQCPHALL